MWFPAFIGRAGYFPGFLAPFTIFWQIFAFQWMFVSLILFSIYFPVRSRTDIRYPWIKWLLIVPQIPIVPATLRAPVRPALSQPLHPTLSLRVRSAGARGKCLRRDFSLHLHRRDRGQALRRSRPRARCPPPPGRGGRRFAARPGPGARPAGDLHPFRKAGHGDGAFLGPAHRGRPVHLLSPLARLHRHRAARPRPAHHPPPGHALRLCPRHAMGSASHRLCLPGLPPLPLCSYLRPRGPAHRPHRLRRHRSVSAPAHCPASFPMD